MNVSTILDQIDLGSIALPEFQRGYVWNREQVRNFMDSLYRRHPVGSLLVWETKTDQALDHARGDGKLAAGTVKLLLDGQQRITSLYGIVRGKPPAFFSGNANAFMNLYFNLDSEDFEFYASMKMQNNPLWIGVTDLMQKGVGPYLQSLMTVPELLPAMGTYIGRLNQLAEIRNINLHIEEVTGADKTVDVVVDIFNKVNSGGTKLSKGDLALARICAPWPQARDEMSARLAKWQGLGFYFDLDWLLRVITSMLTGKAQFSFLKDVTTPEFQQGLVDAEQAVDLLLDLLGSRLGLDHDRVLASRYALPVLARYLKQQGGKLPPAVEQNQMLYWYIQGLMWGRFSGSTESVIGQDLATLDTSGNSLKALITKLRQDYSNLSVSEYNFAGYGQGARFYPLLYMLTRIYRARDWGSGLELSAHLLGKNSGLELHHIFPKYVLYQKGYSRAEVNSLANLTFLTKDANLWISARRPHEYFEAVEAAHPGALASHWIPMDKQLWHEDRYRDFLAARRELLARATNQFLEGLLSESPASTAELKQPLTKIGVAVGGIESDEEGQQIEACSNWLASLGLPRGTVGLEIVGDEGELIAVLDLAWPRGLQEGYSQPVALLLNEGKAVEEAANGAGFRYFTSVGDLRRYVEQEILVVGTVS